MTRRSALALLLWSACAHAQPFPSEAALGRPAAVIDLRTADGVQLVGGQWRYHDVTIVPVDSQAPGPDLKPSGAPLTAYDIAPRAGAADFDDAAWPVIAPETLRARRAAPKLSFNWYRINVTIPPRVGGFDPRGATVAFEVVVDDYAEVWVNGALPAVLGQSGGAVVKGFNAPNRVVLTRDAVPGQRFQLAVLGVNGPLSAGPNNFIWVKSATLDFFPPRPPDAVPLRVARLDPRLDAVLPPNPTLEKLAGGFQFVEGPVWVRDGGYLLFSDPNDNRIYRWSADDGVSIYRTKSGYSGLDIGAYHQPGSNGLALDRDGRLTIDQHGNRRVVRLERNGEETVLADRYQGKRLNSPNDLVYRSDGSLYFTDPPFGLPKGFDDPGKELAFSGVYRRAPDGALTLVAQDLSGPNGLAFSPDETALYVGDWDEQRKVILRYPVHGDGGLGRGEVFADLTAAPGEDALDGLKVDQHGNVYASGPGGLWIFAPDGTPLGTLSGPEHPHNLAWGDDGRSLYLAAQTGLYRLRLSVSGTGW
ncbi:MAG: SMP-30/gluconolactonase/LRE family protein [Deltaproteobacteria bacterium]|nr:SMP-30/gluconolactonase/LRE family protein [Deltaproteobacteria bacterium]